MSKTKVDVPHIFLKRGNCIPLALAHITGEYQHIQTGLSDTDNRDNMYAASRFSRTYRQALTLTHCKLVPHTGFAIDADGVYLLHTDGAGSPHCIGVTVKDAKSSVIIWDGEEQFALPWSEFNLIVNSAIDASSFITFRVFSSADACIWPTDIDKADLEALLELQAGGKKASSTLKRPASANLQTVCKKVAKPVLRRPAAGCDGADSESECNSEPSIDLEPLDVTDPADEAIVVVGDKLLALLKSEVAATKRLTKFSPVDRCPLCPFRRFPHRFAGASATRVRQHMTTYHVPSTQFCCSGTKQLKVVIALYDNDILMRQVPCKLLSRSAEIVRNTVFPEIQSNIMIIDKLLRVVFDHDGIKFVNADYAINDEIVRRVGNLFYTRRFAELLLREVLIYNGKMKSVMQRIAIQVASQGCEIANLLPVNGKSWWPMVEDVFASPAVQALRYVLLAELETHTEYTSISIDATLRICLSILGQSAKKDTASAYSAGDSVKRVLSVKGRTGAVLAMIPMSAETSEVVTKALSDNMSVIAKQQVKFVFCDNASPKLLTHLSTIFPVLETLALDPVHLPIVYEYSTWRKRTPGSIFLRTIMATWFYFQCIVLYFTVNCYYFVVCDGCFYTPSTCKAKFNKRDNTRTANSWGPFYCGDSTDKLDKAESIMRQKILDRLGDAFNRME